jgi:hypothetical protein
VAEGAKLKMTKNNAKPSVPDHDSDWGQVMVDQALQES